MNINIYTYLSNIININTPLEQFEVVDLIGLNLPILGGYYIALTNLGFYSLFILFAIISIHLLTYNENIIPNRSSIIIESIYTSVNNMVRDQIGRNNEIYLPFIYSLFLFILLGNLFSNVPYSFAITSSMIFSLGLSFTIVLGVTIIGFEIHGIKFFSFFVPVGTPLGLVPVLVLIELISYIARAFSLGIRLFANICAGHTLLKILSGFIYTLMTTNIFIFFITLIPFALFLAIVGLELAVSLIQTYVFTVLTCSYIKDSIDLH